MKTIPALSRVATFGLLLVAALSPTLRAQRVLFPYGAVELEPLALGSYVHWSNYYENQQNGRIGYERRSDFVTGQMWEYDDGVDSNGYDVFRAFVVFDLPRFTGVVTREEVGIPDGVRPEISVLQTQVLFAHLSLPGVTFVGSGDRPIEQHWTTLSAAALADGAIDPATAFNGLTQGHLFDLNESSLPQSFTDLLNHSSGGPVVFSFTMPVIDQHTLTSLAYFDRGVSLTIGYAGYEAFAPVPEPATYGLGGILLCFLAAAGSRRLRTKPASGVWHA